MTRLLPSSSYFIMFAMKKDVDSPRRPTGRPRSFSREVALEQAMLAFWRNGYETTSVAMLTSAMAITAPALYSAFGDKKQLFLEAVRRYVGDEEAAVRAIEDAPTAYEAARLFLSAAVTTFTGKNNPAGCMLASSTASGSEESADVREVVAGLRRRMQQALEHRIQRDIREGTLGATVKPAALAGMIMSLQLGLSVLARDGASRRELLLIVEQGLEAWPTTAQ